MIVPNKIPGLRALRNYSMVTGFLFYNFANVEAMLSRAVKTFVAQSLVDKEDNYFDRVMLSGAVIGSQRFTGLRDLYKRLQSLQGRDPDRDAKTNAIFSHLGDIQWLRDRLAHQTSLQATKPYDGRWLNHDLFTTKAILEPRPILVHAEDINSAGIDCSKAYIPLELALIGKRIDGKAFTDADAQLPSWLYKPSALVQGRRNIEKALQQRALPPRSHRA